MAPLADALIFLTIGLLFSFYAWRFTRVNSIRLLIFILVFVFGFSTIQYLPIHWLAMEILSLGIAVAGANAVQNHKTIFIKLVRGSSPILIGIIALAGITLRSSQWLQERQSLASLPQADPDLPNIILIVMDTVRAEN